MSDPNQLITQAMSVLREAHEVADAIRADADRYARDRRTEADLLLGKARRVLLAAETKAGTIVAAARHAEPSTPHAGGEPDVVLDLDTIAAEEVLAGGAPDPDAGGDDAERTDERSSLERLLDAAIARAVTQALPREPAS